MGFLKYFSFLLFFSCSKVGYLLDQAGGQLEILKNAKKNEFYLKDSKTPKIYKEKIKLIEKYKTFFYQYFNQPTTEIYSQTYLLSQDAVTYLVIASKFDEIKPKKFSFPFVGSFPYIGFFHQNEAKKFARRLERENYITWTRPVYAYSTLGYFEDRILSSFFRYSDYGLAELIFHELFHTIFFIKDEVSLNENLANLFGKNLAMEYFKLDDAEILKIKEDQKLSEKMRALIVKEVQKLKEKLASKKWGQEEAKLSVKKFVHQEFHPRLKQFCLQHKIKNCWPTKSTWNNARFAAFLTYEKKQIFLEKLKGNKSLKDFYAFLKLKYKNYQDDDKGAKSFNEYLNKI